jgi:hypothetical protein
MVLYSAKLGSTISQAGSGVQTLKMKYEVGTVTGCLDIPPYVTMVPPCLKNKGYGYA